MKFQPITLSDKLFLLPYFKQSPSRQLVDCFEAFYLWRDVYRVEIARQEEFLLCKVSYDERPFFFFPFGTGELAPVIRSLKEYCAAQGHPLAFTKLQKSQLEALQALFPGELTACSPRDQAEYLFSADTFRFYRGKALQAKRNFVNYARKNYAWSYETVSYKNLAECRLFARAFHGEGTLESDNEALRYGLEEYESLDMEGGLIRINGAIAALLICRMLGDGQTAAGLFLRGDHTKKGVIPLLYQTFFEAHPEFLFFNFGEDLGVEGLRQNKLSFQPTELLELYEVYFQ